MSGIEVAGLVLGAIPLLLASMEFYSKGIALSRRYFKYRQQFQSLLTELRTEKTICENSLHLLLVGIVKQNDMSIFLADPGGNRWKDGHFNEKLRNRLGTSYDSYIATIDELRRTIEVFKQRLKLDALGNPKFSDETEFRKHYKRLDFSLKKSDYDDLMNSLRRANSSINRMTTQKISLEALHISEASDTLLMPKYDLINDHAQKFHDAIESGWQCPCHNSHTVHLRLEHRMDHIVGSESDEFESLKDPFHVVLRYDNHNNTSAHLSPTIKNPWNWEEADVFIAPCEKASNATSAICESSPKRIRLSKGAKTAVHAALGPARNMKPIQSLCATISQLQPPQRDICLSLLAKEYAKITHNLLIYPSKSPPPDTENWSVRNLESVLGDARFSRRHRMQTAVTLASSILQLRQTPWLADNWSKSDVLFIEKSGQTAYTDPFVLKQRQNQSQAGAAAWPPLMRYIIRNQALYALGIALIELWYGKPLSVMHKPEDGLFRTDDLQTDLITELATANRVMDELCDDAGGNYANAVRRCLNCDFDCRFKTFEDRLFMEAVFQGVVAQVKETFDIMFRTTS